MKNILVINALNGVFPLVLRKRYPSATITCAEVFPFYKHHLKNLGFEVVDWKTIGEDVKFDIVIGNPPYQNKDTNLKGNLWSQFILKSAGLVNDNGIIAMVSPPSWMSGTDGNGNSKKKDLHNFFVENDILSLNLDAGDHFHNIGSKFSYFIVKKNKTGVLTRVTSQHNVEDIDLSDFIILPNHLTKLNLSIVNKFIGMPDKKPFTSKGCVGYPKPIGKAKYTIYNTGSSMASSDHEPANSKLKKVIVSVSGYPKAIYDDGKFGCSINSYWTEVVDKDEGKLYVDVFKSKLVQWMFSICKYSGFNNILLLKMFPKIPKDISDQNLYNYFGLSTEEVDLVSKSGVISQEN